jgi:hypothetical protein
VRECPGEPIPKTSHRFRAIPRVITERKTIIDGFDVEVFCPIEALLKFIARQRLELTKILALGESVAKTIGGR